MSETTLRAYIKEIDDLVEHEHLDEAISHCRHILETYPKHLETYRLLGKAYLEAKRHGDAADLFQRVLSAIPDDFVSHVGMAIVREDEGNVDASIWHMERAFETNPANPAIQQEMRRLIGKRDGLEPHKVRLTRGALARMYAHGELYPQAIAELRSALQEDADRPDLQVLLASLYWRTDQRAEAAEVSNVILGKLPFCREANRIAAAALQAAGKVDEAAVYHRRLASLDPYAAFVENAMLDPSAIDASSVRMEKLRWQPGESLRTLESGRPDWATSLGVDLQAGKQAGPAAGAAAGVAVAAGATAAAASLPSWLDVPQPAQAGAAPPADAAVHPFAGAPSLRPDIPEWMQEAGWGPSAGQAKEAPVNFSEEELEGRTPAPKVEPGSLVPADIPPWLQDLAPQPAATDESPTAVPPPPSPVSGPQAIPDWSGETPAVPSASKEELVASPPTEPLPMGATPLPADGADLPVWLESAPGATATIVTWLGDRSGEPPGTTQDWMKETGPLEKDQPAVPPMPDAPDWLKEAVSFEGEADYAPPEEVVDAPPAWLSGVAEAAANEPEPVLEPPAWFGEEIVAREPVSTAPPAEPSETSPEAVPDWLRAIASPGTRPGAAEPPAPEGMAVTGLGATAAAAWLKGIGEDEPPQPGAGALPPGEGSADWLQGILAPQETEAPSGLSAQDEAAWLGGLGEAQSRESIPAAEAPDWLKGILEPSSPDSTADFFPSEPLASPASVGPARGKGGTDWLRGILENETLPPEPSAAEEEEIVPEPADWLARAVGAEPSFAEEAAEAPDWLASTVGADAPAEDAAAEAPDWLARAVGAESPAEDGLAETQDWLQRLGLPPDESPVPADAFEVPAGLPEDLAALLGVGAGAVAEMPENLGRVQEPQEETPDWLKEFAEAATDEVALSTPPTSRPSQPLPSLEFEGALDWLEEERPPTQPVTTRPAVAVPIPTGPAVPQPVAAAQNMDDDEISRWLEQLAGLQTEPGISPLAVEDIAPAVTGALSPDMLGPSGRVAPPPEEPEAGLDWLERLAGARESEGPTAAAEFGFEPPAEPEFPEPLAEPLGAQPIEPEDDVLDWLKTLAPEQLESASEEAPGLEAAALSSAPTDETVVFRRGLEEAMPAFPSARPSEAIPVPPTPEPMMASPAPAEAPEPAAPILLPPPVVIVPPAAPPAAPPTPIPAAFEAAPPVISLPAVAVPPVTITPPPAPQMPVTLPTPVEPILPSVPAAQLVPPSLPEISPASEPVVPTPGPEPEPIVAGPPAPPAPIVVPPPPLPIPPAPAAAPAPFPIPDLVVPPPAPEPLTAPVLVIPPPVIQPAPAAAVTPPSRAKAKASKGQEFLDRARAQLAAGDLAKAAKEYGSVIKRRYELDKVIEELRMAAEHFPREAALWQALGDAYMRDERTTEAIAAYQKGMENV